MDKNLLHTPVGVRDIYGRECELKLSVEWNINKVFNLYGYKNIQTPTFEYFDVFSEKRGSVPSKDLYKFFDREGNTLVLKPDMTPSIARMISRFYSNIDVPVKVCYNANTFINSSELQGKSKEKTQLGCELINDGTVEADAEVIALVVESLKAAGLKDFLVEVGNVEFYGGLIEEFCLDDATEKNLRSKIENKNSFEIEKILESGKFSTEAKNAIKSLPELFGNIDVIPKAEGLTSNKKALAALDRLKLLYGILQDYGVSEHVRFDLGMLQNFDYYTGIIFRAYTHGNGDSIVRGGRYDKLLSQFGMNAPAVGFAVFTDSILASLTTGLNDNRLVNEYRTLIYEPKHRKYALKLADDMRRENIDVKMISRNADIGLDSYSSFEKSDGASVVLVLTDDGIKEI